MKLVKWVVLLISVIYLMGCASGAQIQGMTYSGEKGEYDVAFEENVSVSSVTGGKKTNPAWTSQISNENFESALKESLKNQGIYSESGEYQLVVSLVKIEQPLFGLDLKVVTHINYKLKEIGNNNIILDETIVAEHTATFSDAFAAVKRLRLANEGAAKNNIVEVLKKLESLDLSGLSVSFVN